MYYLKPILSVLFFTLSISAFAQSAELLKDLPTTKEEYLASEKNVLATIDWLESTPVHQEEQKHKQQYTLLIGWITNSANVTVEINEATTPFLKKNGDLLIFFLGGWTRYALTHSYSNDVVQGTVAGLKSVLKMYRTGDFKKDKDLKKLLDLEEKGELEKWVVEQLGKK